MQTLMLKKPFFLASSCLLLAGLVSCNSSSTTSSDIVVSFYPLEYLASRIVGNKLSVSSIVPPGSEPHDFELKTSDVMKLYDAKAVFLNGLGMEPFESSVKTNPNLGPKTTVLADSIDNLITVAPSSGGSYVDPHIWLDTDIYASMGKAILDKVVTISPENKVLFESNYASLIGDLSALKAYGQGLGLSGKTIAVSHDAFRYMGREFGFDELFINGFSPDDEPSAAALQSLLDAIEEKGIDTIFFEELENQDIATYIAQQTGAKVEVLSPLETITEGENYLSVYRRNLDKIAEAKSK